MSNWLVVDDVNTPEDYDGMFILTDPDSASEMANQPPVNERPYPYKLSQKITITGLSTKSSFQPKLSPNSEVNSQITFRNT